MSEEESELVPQQSEDISVIDDNHEETVEQLMEFVVPNPEEPTVKRLRKEDIRKPYSKWVLFCIETRPKVLHESPGASFKEIANSMAAQFRTLSSEDNERLDKAVAADKIRYSKELENSLPDDNRVDTTELIFPLGKIKRIAKLDPDVKNISKDSLITMTKATELFVAHMALKCSANVALRGARTMNESDVVNVIHGMETLEFLRLDFPKVNNEKKKTVTGRNKQTEAPAVSAGKGILEIMAGNGQPRDVTATSAADEIS